MKFRTQYDAFEDRRHPGIECKDPSLTDQSAAPECDINVMLERFKVTGQIKIAAQMPMYGDYTQITDFQSARNAIIQAEDQFMLLPPEFRETLGHDPQKFLLYVADPDNRAALVKKGWLVERQQPGGIGGVAPDAKPADAAAASAA